MKVCRTSWRSSIDQGCRVVRPTPKRNVPAPFAVGKRWRKDCSGRSYATVDCTASSSCGRSRSIGLSLISHARRVGSSLRLTASSMPKATRIAFATNGSANLAGAFYASGTRRSVTNGNGFWNGSWRYWRDVVRNIRIVAASPSSALRAPSPRGEKGTARLSASISQRAKGVPPSLLPSGRRWAEGSDEGGVATLRSLP